MKLSGISLPRSLVEFFNPPRPSDSWGDFYPRYRFTLDEFNQIKKIKVKELGDVKGITAIPNEFTVRLGQLEMSHLTVDVEGPIKPNVRLLGSEGVKNKTVKMSYKVFTPGTYVFEINYRGYPVPGSPFISKVEEFWPTFVPALNSQAVFAVGKGLKQSTCDQVAVFKLDTSAAGNGILAIKLINGDEELINRDRIGASPQLIQHVKIQSGWMIEYMVKQEGPYLLEIKYGGTNIPGSPFSCHCYGINGQGLSANSLTSWFKRKNPVEEEERRQRWAASAIN